MKQLPVHHLAFARLAPWLVAAGLLICGEALAQPVELLNAPFEGGTLFGGAGPPEGPAAGCPVGPQTTWGAPGVDTGIEPGRGQIFNNCDPADPGRCNCIFVEETAPGARRLRIVDDDGLTSVVRFQTTIPPGFDSPVSFIDFRFSVDPAASGTADALMLLRVDDQTNAELAQSRLGLSQGVLRYKIIAANNQVLLASGLAATDFDDDWRVLIRIDRDAGTQTHWLWKDGKTVEHPLLGTAHPWNGGGPQSLPQYLDFISHPFAVDCALDDVRITGGAPATGFATDLVALPDAGGVRLSWSNVPDGSEAGYRVDRALNPAGPWTVQAGPDQLPAGATEFVDSTALTPRALHYYRVTAVGDSGGEPAWSNVAAAVPVFTGKPFHGWLNVADFVLAQGAEADDTDAIQAALNALGGRGDDPARSAPHVLYFPAGTYLIDRTLYLEGHAGVQLVGESIGSVVLRWTGPPGTSPHDAAVMFHAEGNRDAAFRNLVWDGGCASTPDPWDTCFVVAFDQSYCGRPDTGNYNADECGAQNLGWPEDPMVGFADTAGLHLDSTFRNAYIGLRIGHHQVEDDSTTIRRCRFLDNFIGASIEDFNALRHWFWDDAFERNFVGISNDPGYTRRAWDPAFPPGTCRKSGLGCVSKADCDPDNPDDVCSRDWAGDFDVLRGRFIDNVDTDIWSQPTGAFNFRDSWSAGGGRFVFGAGPNSTAAQYTILGNQIEDVAGPAVDLRSPGALLLLDNTFFSGDDAPVVRAGALAGGDIISLGNGFTVPYDPLDPVVQDLADPLDVGPFHFTTPFRLRSLDDRQLTTETPAPIPPLPVPVDSLALRPVYTVTDSDRIQEVFNAALSDDEPAIVHFPSSAGVIDLSQTLRIPSASDLIVTGDGNWTTLRWTGPAGEPALDIDVAGTSSLTVRDLQVRDGGIRITGAGQADARLLLSRMRAAQAGDAAYAFQGLDGTRVELVDHYAASSRLGIAIQTGTTAVDPGLQQSTAIWSGVMLGNRWDFDVAGSADVGPRTLITGTYMEDSTHHLRVSGRDDGPHGNVAVHGGKQAPIVVLQNVLDVEELKRETATIDIVDFPGDVSLSAASFFIQRANSLDGCCSSDEAADYGARIRASGSAELQIRSIGATLRAQPSGGLEDHPEYDLDLAPPATHLRLAGKRYIAGAVDLEDLRVEDGVETLVPLSEDVLGDLEPALELLRTLKPAGFYDEPGATALSQWNLDKVFLFTPGPVGLVVLAGDPVCETDADCDDEDACNGHEVCRMGACLRGEEPNCNDGIACTDDACDPMAGCIHLPDDNACADGVDCTQDVCTVGMGCSNQPLDEACDDGRDCTVDTCDPEADCINDEFCPAGETCDGAGQCAEICETDADCNDALACTFDICLTVFGQPVSFCKNQPRHFLCDDGLECTADVCDADSGCTHPRDCAGQVPDGSGVAAPIIASKDLDNQSYTLTWSAASCMPGARDYSIYEGAIGQFESHSPSTCSTGGETSATFPLTPVSVYLLVVPHDGVTEGGYGIGQGGNDRGPGPVVCFPQDFACY